jgi:hypothetical protein
MDRLMICNIKFFFIALIGLFGVLDGFIEDALAESPYYYTISYATPEWGCGIKVSKINLDTKEVVDFDTAGLCYWIADPRAIVFTRNDSNYIFAATVNCGTAKRSEASNDCFSDYIIYNDAGRIVSRGVIENSYIQSHKMLFGEEIYIKYSEHTDSLHYWRDGTINLLEDNSISIIPDTFPAKEDPTLSIISGFQYFDKIDERNNTIYWDVAFRAEYLLRIDIDKKILLDSLRITDKRNHSCLFALSNDQTKIYTFHFGGKCGSCYYENGPPPVLPSYIKIYRADTLVMIDSFPAPDPLVAGGYVTGDWWPCEAIGDYRVYYFFASELPEFFAPAMLYIFDTRNNESTWLNIGWR